VQVVNYSETVGRNHLIWKMMAVCGHRQSGRTMMIAFVLLLMMTIARVQGYFNSDLNGTIVDNYVHQNEATNGHGRQQQQQQKHFNQRQFDQILDYYRSDGKPSRREPRFISFQTKDDNIEVEIDFAIPFLSIPVKRSLSGAMGTLQSVISVSRMMAKRKRPLLLMDDAWFCNNNFVLVAGHSDGKY
jgi:hypothetical protein